MSKKPQPEIFYLECRCNEADDKELSNSYTFNIGTNMTINIQYCDEHKEECENVIALIKDRNLTLFDFL